MSSGGPADIVLAGGPFWTFDPSLPVATSLAIRGWRIVAVGSAAEVSRPAALL